jgi:hypothetical protein
MFVHIVDAHWLEGSVTDVQSDLSNRRNLSNVRQDLGCEM